MNLDDIDSTPLTKLQNFDTSKLDREAALGSSLNFQNMIVVADKITEHAKALDPVTVHLFPDQNQSEIYQACDRILGDLNTAINFDPSQGDAARVRNSIVSQINSGSTIIFNLVLKYGAFAFRSERHAGFLHEALSRAEKLQKTSDKLETTFKNAEKRYNEKIAPAVISTTEQIQALKKNYKDTLSELEATKSELRDDIQQTFEAKKTEIFETLKLDEARQLWDEKFKQHRLAYNIVGIALLMVLLGLPTLTYYNLENLSQKVIAVSNLLAAPSFEQQNLAIAISNQVTKLLMIGLPISALIWLLRILVRIFLANRALMDDAQQRQVMLDTYLFLVGENSASENDRPIVLNALFRPSPGHTADIEPPNIGDVLRVARKKQTGE